MRGNVLGPVDKTVNVLIDRSYPVVKEVFKNLDAIKNVYEKEDIISDMHKNLDRIENVQEAANHLNRIAESIDKLDELQENITSLKDVHQNLDTINSIVPELETITSVADNLEAIGTVSENIQEVDTVVSHLEDIKKAAKVTDDIATVAPQVEAIQLVAGKLDNVTSVAGSLEDIKSVASNIESIKASEENALKINAVLDEVQEIEVRVQEDLNESNVVLGDVQNIHQQVIAKGNELIASGEQNLRELEAATEIKKEELLSIAGNYFTPSVSKEGVLFWTNNGGFENPNPVNITGPKGDKGDQGEGLIIVATYAILEDLKAAHPVGQAGNAYFIEETSEVYIWDIDDRRWESIGVLRGVQGEQGAPGLSANEILMDPDPVAYFNQIYGVTDIASGDLIIDVSGTEPDATLIFENYLNS